MLNKKEIAVMRIIYDKCKAGNDSCILSVKYILEAVPEKFKLNENQVDSLIKQLEYDGYLDCVKSERKGQAVMVVNLKQKGQAFKRELVQRRREIVNTTFWRVIFAALGAVVALLVNRLMNI